VIIADQIQRHPYRQNDVIFLLIDNARIFHEYARRQHEARVGRGIEFVSLGAIRRLVEIGLRAKSAN
jgi:hypothetical protein